MTTQQRFVKAAQNSDFVQVGDFDLTKFFFELEEDAFVLWSVETAPDEFHITATQDDVKNDADDFLVADNSGKTLRVTFFRASINKGEK